MSMLIRILNVEVSDTTDAEYLSAGRQGIIKAGTIKTTKTINFKNGSSKNSVG
ncbi:MAG TPA: hypothetical protein VGQ09_10415 [Chitinophagaceae bacterium]|nr:hypothetical protein [Chitinophagaceae bacterium]